MCFAHTSSGPLPKENLAIDHAFCTYMQWPFAKGNTLAIDHVFCTYMQWPIAKLNVAIDHYVFASLQKDLQIASYRA
jgi:hypothetical protein